MTKFSPLSDDERAELLQGAASGHYRAMNLQEAAYAKTGATPAENWEALLQWLDALSSLQSLEPSRQTHAEITINLL